MPDSVFLEVMEKKKSGELDIQPNIFVSSGLFALVLSIKILFMVLYFVLNTFRARCSKGANVILVKLNAKLFYNSFIPGLLSMLEDII